MALLHVDFFSDVLGMCMDMDVILPQQTSGQIGMEGKSRIQQGGCDSCAGIGRCLGRKGMNYPFYTVHSKLFLFLLRYDKNGKTPVDRNGIIVYNDTSIKKPSWM